MMVKEQVKATPYLDGKKYITPKQYSGLPEGKQDWYLPEFKKYKTVKERTYCDECGHFTGWSSREVGIGEVWRYRKAEGVLEVSTAIMTPRFRDSILHSNILMDRVLKK